MSRSFSGHARSVRLFACSSSLIMPFCFELRFSQLRSSNHLSPLNFVAALAPPVRRRWFHSSRRTSSSAAVAHSIRWKVSGQTSAPGESCETTVRIHSAPAQMTNWSLATRCSPWASKNELTVLVVRPFAQVVTDDGEIPLPLFVLHLVDRDGHEPESRSTRPSASVTTRTQALFTARQLTA